MNYYFTGILIILLTLLAFCVTPAYPRNEYLNDGSARCGEVDVSVSVSYTHLTLPTKRIV